MASAIVIEEYEPIETQPTTSDGENVNVALIKGYIDEKTDNLANIIEFLVNEKVKSINDQIDSTMQIVFYKIGVGVVTICLFLFQLLLGYYLFIAGRVE